MRRSRQLGPLELETKTVSVSTRPTDPPQNSPSNPPLDPDEPTTAQPLADVPYFGSTREWNVNAISAPEAWAAGYTGQGVTVAVVDTGVQLNHPDLHSSLWQNIDEVLGDGIDNDRNGFVDDRYGWDFVARDNNPTDGHSHGTHVAGTIAAANDGSGAIGVAYDAQIMPVHVLDKGGSGSTRGVAQGIRYAVDNGADIIWCRKCRHGYCADASWRSRNNGRCIRAILGFFGIGSCRATCARRRGARSVARTCGRRCSSERA